MSENPASDPEIQTLFGADKVEIHHSAAPVGEWPISAWCRAMGDENPVYGDRDAARRHGHEDVFAPPVMMLFIHDAWIVRRTRGRPALGVAARIVEAWIRLGTGRELRTGIHHPRAAGGPAEPHDPLRIR